MESETDISVSRSRVLVGKTKREISTHPRLTWLSEQKKNGSYDWSGLYLPFI